MKITIKLHKQHFAVSFLTKGLGEMIKQNFNADWVFYKKDHPERATEVHLPHDAMRLQKRIKGLKNGGYTGFFPSGDYCYEKKIFGKPEYTGKTLMLEFEGVYMDSKVYLNGQCIGGRVYGYSHFYVDLTGKLIEGQENLLLVTVHCSQVPNARWYPGNGIYRPVNLWVAEAEHIPQEAVTITTLSTNPAKISLDVKAIKEADTKIVSEIFYAGQKVAEAESDHCEIEIPNAKLWDAENPHLYEARIHLKKGDAVIDTSVEPFGIRSLKWNPKEGLLFNGKSVKLKGGCVHHDNGILGACEFEAAAYRRIRILKEAGFNAIRSSHYPLSKTVLKACDELGMYVKDEAFDSWRESQGLYGYPLVFDEEWKKDLEGMVQKDKNHPSVIIYSIGNEIPDTATPAGAELTKVLADFCRNLDDTRPITVCPNLILNIMHKMGVKVSVSGDTKPQIDDITDPLAVEADSDMGGSALINQLVALAPLLKQLLLTPKKADKAVKDCYQHVDIAGYNYGSKVYKKHYAMHPERIIIGSETSPCEIAENWELVKQIPTVIGDFMWTAWDYLGEGGAGEVEYGKGSGSFVKSYPIISAYTGAIDLIGHKDTFGHLASIVWEAEKEPFIAVRPVDKAGEKVRFSSYRTSDALDCWTWEGHEGKKTEVQVYSPGYTVELLQDGRSLGKKKLKNCKASFLVTYRPGILEAVCYDKNGKKLSQSSLKTAGKETILTCHADKQSLKAGAEDLVFVDIALTDKEGIVKCAEAKTLTVQVEGAGMLEAVGSGALKTTEEYTGDHFTTYQGRMQAIVRSGKNEGKIRVTVSGDNLKWVTELEVKA